MTYNILFGGVGREERIRDVVEAVHPDVAVFTEVTSADSFDVIAEAVGPHRAEGAIRKNGQRAVIVSRWPLTGSRLLGPPWAPQKWVEATVQPFGGPPVSVCGVHFMPQPLFPFELCRRIEVRSLVEQLRPLSGAPHIVTGDFNALMPGDRFLRERAELWVRIECAIQGGWPRWALKGIVNAGYTDCYRACHERGDGFTVPAWDPAFRVDYVFASPALSRSLRTADTYDPGAATIPPRRSLAELLGWKPVRSLGDAASDHLPVWADFEWHESPRASDMDKEEL
jgi:endonuclease/exonuclease/phosphatase family metal-dependent hydrolase